MKSTQLKIAFWAGLCLFLATTIIIAYSAITLRTTAVDSSKKQAIAIAESEAAVVDAEIEVAMDSARTLAQALSAVKRQDSTETLSRKMVLDMLLAVLEQNPTFLGTYTAWEPDTFDGKDDEYAGTSGHDETGRFIPYWTRNEQGNIQLESLADYEVERKGDYYLCPKRTLQECIIDPYIYTVQGEEVLLTSLVAPIIVDGTFYGIVGVDITLDFLQSLADSIEAHDLIEEMSLISYNGNLTAVTGHPEMVGQYATALHPEYDTEKMNSFQKADIVFHIHEEGEEKGQMEVFVPIEFGRATTPWSVNLIIPEERILGVATQQMWQLVAIGVALTCIALVLIWFVAHQIAQPIQHITHVAGRVTEGHLDTTASVMSDDEMGVLARAFNQMIESLRQKMDEERVARADAQEKNRQIESDRQHIETSVVEYLAFIEQVAEGDLTVRLDLHGDEQDEHDPLLRLGRHLNGMAERLQEIIGEIREASSHITTTVTSILSATSQQSASAAEQSAAITQTTTTVEELRAVAQQTTTQATLVAQESQAALVAAQQGTQSVEETIAGMSRIQAQVESIAQTTLELVEKTDAIGGIITTVSEIADQSNMLALNAAIEAARAGEQGKSFGVVAQHVRDLAERSKSATVQVRDILGEIQQATQAVVMVAEQGSKNAEQGTDVVQKTGQVIRTIADEVENGAKSNMQIAAAAQQQTAGVEQVMQAMKSINQAMNQTLEGTRSTEQSVKKLGRLADSLKTWIDIYRV